MAAPVVTCTCRACSKARTKIQQIFKVLDIYGWLLDSYMVDFFQEQLWEKLPNSWKIVLQTVPLEEFGNWLTADISCTRVWPLSLLALRQVTKYLQIDRDDRNDENILQCGTKKEFQSYCSPKHFTWRYKNQNPDDLYVTLNKHNNLFLKHVKIKKRHEIEQIIQVCVNCAHKSNVKCIVDVGAGMGHLARSLSFKHNMSVVCLEQDALLSHRAKKWDQELLVSISKHLPNLSINLPQHVAVKLEYGNSDKAESVKDIQKIFSKNFNLSENNARFGIVGLHPCGDLAATLLKLYIIQSEARFICIVGCCYMKLTLKHQMDTLNGYPLSKYLSSVNQKLSYTALEAACHAIENYCDKLRTGNYEDLIVHAYRAALETILIKHNKQLRHSQVKNVKMTKSITFEEYCTAAIADFESHLRPENLNFQNPQIAQFLSQWQQIVLFGALRTMLAPLVETVVLLDRFLFLSENNLSPSLKPIFDPRLSPRNFLLSSTKSI